MSSIQNQSQNPNPSQWQRPNQGQSSNSAFSNPPSAHVMSPPAQPAAVATTVAPPYNPVFDQVDKAAAEQSKFIKIESGQSVVLYFDPNRIRLIDREINGKKSKAVEYDVIDVNTGAEKTLTLSLSWARQLNEFLKAGYNAVKITRRGSGFDTQYTFMPAQ
ncbi:MAG TPA: hypothetical protein VNI77_03815 [Nitrososphaera sp.]|nr:hypothetical protein [Nitrososphaera sp.]